ncbi:MAG: hypothetical protein ACFFD4_10235 [Candidatus Odinarchaeota archaeon]
MPVHGLSALDSRVLPAFLVLKKLQHLTTGAAKGPTSTYQPLLAGRRYVHHGVYLPNTVAVARWATVEINYDPVIITTIRITSSFNLFLFVV